MATLIELVNHLERESGTIYQAQRLSTVASPTGRQEKMVEWIRESWRLIQTSRTDWPWRRREFQSTLVVGQKRYTAANLGIADFSAWQKYTPSYVPFTVWDPAIGQQDEKELWPVSYARWATSWDRATHDAARPAEYAVDDQRRLCIGPKPLYAYPIRGAYICKAQALVVDDDEPICPEDHHMTIVWRALMLMGAHDEALNVVAYAQSLYAAGVRAMLTDMDEQVEA